MTSSLVGSEMCIRDRVWVWVPGMRRLRSSRSRDSKTDRFSAPGTPSAPVSYTHLTLPTICSV
eukprot:2548393-Prorocentrum_lima.AAC.1